MTLLKPFAGAAAPPDKAGETGIVGVVACLLACLRLCLVPDRKGRAHHGAHTCIAKPIRTEGEGIDHGEATVNTKLAEAMHGAGLSNKALARQVGSDHTAVSRWLNGVQPRPASAQAICDCINQRTNQRLVPADLGFSTTDTITSALGLNYGQNGRDASRTARQLWRADLDELDIIMSAPVDNAAWSEATLNWLVRRVNAEPMPLGNDSRVGQTDINAIRDTAEFFSTLDAKFGGGHARRALIQYLHSDVKPLLAGRYSDATGRLLHTAVAESLLLAAWMSYDAGIHGLAQRYFIQALRLAHDADDVLLAGSILDAMSHQATFLGRHREAANLARAAADGTRGAATATLTAHFHAMEARALAVAGDCVGAEKALSDAVKLFERRRPAADPEWISYVDDAELSAEFAHTYRDLGRGDEALAYAGRAVTGASVRSDFFVTMVSASGQLRRKVVDVDSACASLTVALAMGRTLKSARCVQYVREVRQSLAKYEMLAAVRMVEEQHADHPLWLASA